MDHFHSVYHISVCFFFVHSYFGLIRFKDRWNFTCANIEINVYKCVVFIFNCFDHFEVIRLNGRRNLPKKKPKNRKSMHEQIVLFNWFDRRSNRFKCIRFRWLYGSLCTGFLYLLFISFFFLVLGHWSILFVMFAYVVHTNPTNWMNECQAIIAFKNYASECISSASLLTDHFNTCFMENNISFASLKVFRVPNKLCEYQIAEFQGKKRKKK